MIKLPCTYPLYRVNTIIGWSLTRAWFDRNAIQLLDWAPSSPDVSIIEHVWEEIDRAIRRRERRPTTLDQLWQAIQEEWAKLDVNYIRTLYDSMPRRVAALKKAKGGYIKY